MLRKKRESAYGYEIVYKKLYCRNSLLLSSYRLVTTSSKKLEFIATHTLIQIIIMKELTIIPKSYTWFYIVK